MRVFKFGGASVQDADAVRNMAEILKKYGTGPLVIVVSAMGKTTNALEAILNAYWNKQDYRSLIEKLRKEHLAIIDALFDDKSKGGVVDDIGNYFLNLELYFERPLERNYDYIYDQVVCYGELVSTRIVSAYLNTSGYTNKWLDARNLIVTDNLFREARIEWDITNTLIQRIVPQVIAEMPAVIQGFIGSTKDNLTTTLGREGSDYTASIMANALDAKEVVIWKDVPGILNADPKKFSNTVKFDRLSYHEAVEMTYYGARVLHPKTIKPLQNKNIPLNVRSFIKPDAGGTIISTDVPEQREIPVIIHKDNQLLISLATRDYSFIAEENIETIFDEVVNNGIKVNVMSNSAISFFICVDNMETKVASFVKALESEFEIEIRPMLELLTIQHYRQEPSISEFLQRKKLVLELKSGDTVQFVLS